MDSHRTRIFLAAALALSLATGAFAGSPEGPWHTSGERAFAEARESGKMVLVDLYADWCGWCKTLEEQVFSHPRFLSYAERFVLLQVDVMDGGEGSALQARYEAFSLPTTLILNADQVHVGTVSGFAPVEPFLQGLRRELAAWEQAEERRQSRLASEDPAVLLPLARELHEIGDGSRAAAVYARLLAFEEPLAVSDAWLRYLQADALSLAGDHQAAKASLATGRRLAAAERDTELLEAMDLLAINLDHSRGDCRAAAGALRTFLAERPDSSFRRQAQESLRSIESGRDPACT